MKPLNEQINPKIVIQAKKLAQYTQILHQILPIECRNHVSVANIRDQNLILVTDSPVWTTRLRQLSPQVLHYIRDNPPDKGQIIHHLQITTRYHAESNEHEIKHAPHPAPVISEKTAKLLSQSAESIEFQPLKDALLKVSRHVKSTKS